MEDNKLITFGELCKCYHWCFFDENGYNYEWKEGSGASKSISYAMFVIYSKESGNRGPLSTPIISNPMNFGTGVTSTAFAFIYIPEDDEYKLCKIMFSGSNEQLIQILRISYNENNQETVIDASKYSYIGFIFCCEN